MYNDKNELSSRSIVAEFEAVSVRSSLVDFPRCIALCGYCKYNKNIHTVAVDGTAKGE